MNIRLSTVAIAVCVVAAPLRVKAQETTQQPGSKISSSSSPSELNGGESSSSSFIGGNKTRILIVVLSVVVGIVVIFAVATSILYAVAKRRQWAIRDRIRHSARRIVDTIKSPLITPRFPRSGNGHAIQSSSSYAPKRQQQQQQQQNRSSRGMTRIDDNNDNGKVFAATQFVLADNSDGVHGSFKSRDIERYPTWTDSGSLSNGNIQYKPRSAGSDILGSKTSYFFDFSSNPPAPAASARGYNHNRKNDNDNDNNNRKKSRKFRRQKKQDFDLERGIELGATDHMKVVISLSARNDDDEVKPATTTMSKLRSWSSVFALGRR